MSAVSIIGLGWVGEPLAVSLKQQGFEVYGSVRRPEKAAALQIQGIQAEIWQHEQMLPEMLKQSIVVVTLPPGKTPDYVQSLQQLFLQLKKTTQQLIFFSSTSVYSGVGVFDESSPLEPESVQAAAIIEVETLLQQMNFPNWKIIRPSGLISASRHPARFLSGKQRDGGKKPVNLVHQSDVIAAVKALIDYPDSGVFNLASPSHPTRNEFYSSACLVLGLALPQFTDEPSTGKVISGEKIETLTSFQYHIRDWMSWQKEGMYS